MLKRELQAARELCLGAGRILLEHYAREVTVHMKDGNSPVTQADRDSNQFITTKLGELFPDDGILAEESKDGAERLAKRRVWVVDPMDGTKEFIDKVGQFAVMIGLVEDGHPVLGAVYQPTTEMMLFAVKGEGAFLQQAGETKRVSVSDLKAPRAMRLVVSRSHRSPLVDAIMQALEIEQDVKSGSVGLKVGLQVKQDSDLYIHPNSKTKEWDTAAPQIILEEAGGKMTDCWGAPLSYNKEDTYNRKGFVASNGQAHDEIVSRIEPFLSDMD